jgi:hypothetical protein
VVAISRLAAVMWQGSLEGAARSRLTPEELLAISTAGRVGALETDEEPL